MLPFYITIIYKDTRNETSKHGVLAGATENLGGQPNALGASLKATQSLTHNSNEDTQCMQSVKIWTCNKAAYLMCSVMPLVLTTDWKKCSTSCVSYLPMRSVGNWRSKLRCGRPDKSCKLRSTAHVGFKQSMASWPHGVAADMLCVCPIRFVMIMLSIEEPCRLMYYAAPRARNHFARVHTTSSRSAAQSGHA